jgi:hypothetical protein
LFVSLVSSKLNPSIHLTDSEGLSWLSRVNGEKSWLPARPGPVGLLQVFSLAVPLRAARDSPAPRRFHSVSPLFSPAPLISPGPDASLTASVAPPDGESHTPKKPVTMWLATFLLSLSALSLASGVFPHGNPII